MDLREIETDLLDNLILEWVMVNVWGIAEPDEPLPAHSELQRRRMLNAIGDDDG